MRNFIFVLLIFVSPVIFAQKFSLGEVVTFNGDTLRGYIKKQTDTKNANSCIFSFSIKGNNYKDYKPTEISSYKTFDGKLYVSKKFVLEENETLFLEYLVNGIVDLYYLKKDMNEYFLLEKANKITVLNNNKTIVNENGIRFEKNSNQYISVLQMVFADAEKTRQKINKTPFFTEELIDITKKYHNEVCTEYSCLDYTKAFKKSIYYEVGAGTNFSKMTLDNSDFVQANTQPQINLGLKFIDLRKYRKFNFRTGLSFSQNSYDKRFIFNEFDPRTKVVQFKANYYTIRLPITLEVNFNRTKTISPYLSLGISPIYLANLKHSFSRRQSNIDIYPEVFTDYPVRFRSLHYGIHFTPGIYIKLNTKKYLLFTCPLEYRTSMTQTGHIFDFQKHYSIQPSISFGFEKK